MMPVRPTRLYLARHGETLWNKELRLQGTLDSDLTKNGIAQSKALATKSVNLAVDVIVSSSLGRCLATATICQQYLNVPHKISAQLNERHLGEWQGKQIDSLKTHADYQPILHQLNNLAPPNGESAIACAKRINTALLAIAKTHKNKNMLVIVHGEALRCFLSWLNTQPESSHKAKSLANKNAYQLYQNGTIRQIELQQNQHKNDDYFFATVDNGL